MDDLADDLVRFWRALDRGLASVHPARWGAVVTDHRFPDVWDTNYARVESDDPSLSLHEVADALDPALDAAAAAAFHVVMFRPSGTTRLLRELTERGDRLSWDVVMVHDGDRSPPEHAAEELRVDGDLWRHIEVSLPAFGVTEPGTIRQLLRMEREVLHPGITKRWFGSRDDRGEVMGLGALVLLEEIAYVDHIVTVPAARGRGHARTVVTTIVREARAAGARRTFLLVEPEGPVRMYERLGFGEGTRIASTLAPRHGGGR